MKLNLSVAVKRPILCAIAASSILCSAKAQSWEKYRTKRMESDNSIVWSQVSPGNAGMSTILRYHPTIKGKVFLGPDMWNLYQSEDNGTSWYGITDYDGTGSFNRVRDYCYSSKNENLVLSIAATELWRSDNGGKNWERVLNCPWYNAKSDGTESQNWISKVAAIAIDPKDDDTWYVAGGKHVRGQPWLSCFHYINIKTARGKDALNMGMLWKTTNAGKSWNIVNKGLPEKVQIGRIIIHPEDSKILFAASNYGVYKSIDGGKSWKLSSKQIDNNIILDMDFYYNAKSGKFTLYAIDQVQYQPSGKSITYNGGVYMSSDEGKSWQKINGNMALDVNRLSGGAQTFYFDCIAKWFDITPKEARQKYPVIPKATLQRSVLIAADPSREGAVYVGIADPQEEKSTFPPGRLWATTDNGKSWTSTARLYTESWEADKAYWDERGNPYEQNMVLGHESPHTRWGKNYATRTIRGLAVGVDGSVMIISDHTTSLSTDHGKTWHQVDEDYTPSGAIIGRGNSDMQAHCLSQDRRLNSEIFGAGEHRAWIPVYDDPQGRIALKFIKTAPETVHSIAYDPYDANVVYATSGRQAGKQYIFRSDDNGHTWKQHGVATPATNKWNDDFYTQSLVIDPIDPQYMYLGITKISDKSKARDGGFFKSEDGGKTFAQSNSGLPDLVRINDIAFDPRDKSRKSLFAAASAANLDSPSPTEGGLFYSSNRGESWEKVNTPSEIKFVLNMTFDHSGRLYITTGYRGKGNGVWYSDDYGKKWKQTFGYEGAEHVDVSPYDRDLVAVTVRHLALNPGVYLSRDRGKSWSKANKNIVIPQMIEDMMFDIHNPGEMWIATLGCGYYKGKIEGGDKIQVVEAKPDTAQSNNREKINLTASIVNPKYQGSDIVFKSENEAIATVDKNGVVTPTGRGNVKIWATTKDGRFSDYSVITVMK